MVSQLPTILRSGRPVLIRPITPTDADALAAAHAALSDRSRYRRYLAPKPQLSPSELRFLTEVDGDRHVAFVATPVGDPHTILAVGRCVALADDPATAEFAITVGDAYQGEGLGSLLADRLAAAARTHGIGRVVATVLAENLPAHKVMARLTGQLDENRHLGAVDELGVDLAA